MTKTKKHPKKPGPRALARLMAVQALYLLHMNKDATTASVLQDFHNMSQKDMEEMEGVPLITQVDAEFLSDLVTGVSKSESAIKEALEGVLTGSWSFGRLEVILRAILQAGVYELMFRPDVPRPVIINEYIDITHSYYEGKEPGFVNGILDELAKTLRA